MLLLRNEDIIRRIECANPIVKNVQIPKDWYEINSPIQPTSIDLHVGTIQLPPVRDSEKKTDENVLKRVVLHPGATALIKTREEMDFPANISGVVFPPARLSTQGIMLVNPGIVDPGSNKQLHACIINMGRADCEIRENDMILSMMLFMLDEESKCFHNFSLPDDNLLMSLSRDFLNIDTRTREMIKKEINDSKNDFRNFALKIMFLSVIVPLAAGAFTLVYQFSNSSFKEDISKLDGRVKIIEEKLDIKKIEQRLESISQQIDLLKNSKMLTKP